MHGYVPTLVQGSERQGRAYGTSHRNTVEAQKCATQKHLIVLNMTAALSRQVFCVLLRGEMGDCDAVELQIARVVMTR